MHIDIANSIQIDITVICSRFKTSTIFVVIIFVGIIFIMKSYTVYIEKDEDGVFVGSVPTVPGCHTQGATLDELMKNLQEVIVLCTRNTQVTV